MINFYYKRIFSLAVVLVAARGVQAQYWTNGQPASYVIGQAGFGTNASAQSATGFMEPISVIVDPASGKLFVADFNNNRVLRYPSSAAMTNGAAAEAVLGQANFTANGMGTTSTTLNHPEGLAIDAAGNLWVTEYDNNRVLRYANAATIASGAAASGVLGQAGFTTSTASTSAKALRNPSGVFSSGTTLWVADRNNNRVLRFDNAASLANGAPADAVFGQTTLLSATFGSTATTFDGPRQIYVDGADNLWVADNFNDRVLMFPDASTAANGEAATLVLGQPNMTTTGGATGATGIAQVWGVYGDGIGNLYVSDASNERVLIFENAASLANGAAASYVLGQSSFTTNATGDGDSQVEEPQMLFVNESFLALTDFQNNRVLIYVPAEPLPLSVIGFTGRLQANGQVLLQWEVAGSGGAGGRAGGYAQLEWSATDSSGFTDVLNTQPVDPAVSNYSYVQVTPAKGVNEYRVKLIGPDGNATYSSIVRIIVSGGLTALSLYPNPASGTVVVTLPQSGAAVIEVYNSVGGLMRRLSTASSVNTLALSGWAAGVYTVRVVQGANVSISSFIKTN